MFFDYELSEHHVERRQTLPTAVKETLLGSTRSQWKTHPRFHGKANFFMTIHRDLLNGAAQLSGALKQLLDVPESDVSATVKSMNLLPFSKNLIGFAHHHHEIEDHSYFPQFQLLYPNMERAMKLLDGDHRILDQALHDSEEALVELGIGSVTRDKLAELFQGSKALENILNRHIWDEEEIIIPIFLKHA